MMEKQTSGNNFAVFMDFNWVVCHCPDENRTSCWPPKSPVSGRGHRRATYSKHGKHGEGSRIISTQIHIGIPMGPDLAIICHNSLFYGL